MITLINNFSLQEKKKRAAEEQNKEEGSDAKQDTKEERVITLRPLNMEDFREAKNQVELLSHIHCSSKLPVGLSYFCFLDCRLRLALLPKDP